MATVRIPHCFNQAAISFNSAVVHPKRRTDLLSPVGRHGDVVRFIADVNARGMGMYYSG